MFKICTNCTSLLPSFSIHTARVERKNGRVEILSGLDEKEEVGV